VPNPVPGSPISTTPLYSQQNMLLPNQIAQQEFESMMANQAKRQPVPGKKINIFQKDCQPSFTFYFIFYSAIDWARV
jgi:hypothetical protein